MPFVRFVAATALSGVLYGLCFPVASLQPLAWIALVPFLLALRHARLSEALFLGWLWTIVAAYTLGDWFARSVATYYEQPMLVGVAFFMGVSSFMAAPFFMAFAACYRSLAQRRSPILPWLAAAAWVAAELARARLLGGNPWGLFGYSQMGLDRLVQIADVTGVYGVSFILVIVNAALVEARVADPAGRAKSLGGLALACVLAVGVLSYGTWRLGRPAVPTDAHTVRVAMVQGNLDLGSQWREDFYGENLDVYLRLTAQAVRAQQPDIVFWPESALTFFLETEPAYRHAIASVLMKKGVELVVGGPRVEAHSVPVYYNSVFLLAPDGVIRATYDKQRLVPFAEYFPFAAMDFLRRRFARVREFTPGAPRPPLPTRAGPAGVTICNEAMFPEVAAERVREGALYFVDPANDTWLTPKFSSQQFDIVRLRTVEQRRYLVRASTSGPSAIVDPFGRVTVRTEFLTRAAIGGTIALSDQITVYNRVGDLFAVVCTLAALAAWVLPITGGRAG
jgi:apolipoprotein N-acyltransferase